MPKNLMTKLKIPEWSLYMSPLRAIVLSQQYCIITVIWSIIVLFAPFLNIVCKRNLSNEYNKSMYLWIIDLYTNSIWFHEMLLQISKGETVNLATSSIFQLTVSRWHMYIVYFIWIIEKLLQCVYHALWADLACLSHLILYKLVLHPQRRIFRSQNILW